MYSMLQHAHSGLRWVVLGLLVFTVLNALMKFMGKKPFTAMDGKLNFFTPRAMEVQFLVGLALYFLSPKVVFSGDSMGDAVSRFFLLEHPLTMLIAVALISVGSARVKRGTDDTAKFKTTLIFFGISLLLVLAMIPWPFQSYGASWF